MADHRNNFWDVDRDNGDAARLFLAEVFVDRYRCMELPIRNLQLLRQSQLPESFTPKSMSVGLLTTGVGTPGEFACATSAVLNDVPDEPGLSAGSAAPVAAPPEPVMLAAGAPKMLFL